VWLPLHNKFWDVTINDERVWNKHFYTIMATRLVVQKQVQSHPQTHDGRLMTMIQYSAKVIWNLQDRLHTVKSTTPEKVYQCSVARGVALAN